MSDDKSFRIGEKPSEALRRLFVAKVEKLSKLASPAQTQAQLVFAVGEVLDEMDKRITKLEGGSLDAFLSIVLALDLKFHLEPVLTAVPRCDCGQVRVDGRWLESHNQCAVHGLKGCRFVASLESPNSILAREAEQKQKAKRRRRALRHSARLSVDATIAGMDEAMGTRRR